MTNCHGHFVGRLLLSFLVKIQHIQRETTTLFNMLIMFMIDMQREYITVGEISPGWGKTQFVPHFRLGPYLKNDCLKIQIHIAKTVLLSL